MSENLKDSTGAPVAVELDEDRKAYTIAVDAGTIAGRAHYLPGPVPETERIFYHTVVDEEFGGRGLSKILVAEALADCREKGLTVVPICPLFVRKLQETGDDYQAEGGRFRNATGADYAIVKENSR
ncbi:MULTISPECIES: GNAT family N-acetyltransferase [unclassified Brevibacterium]|uniref:GNAT family N-acetyltransferase n=1 Tax=unclassified Brevibacterium TaxID=2614124 RepID=UPI001E447F6D|nr:MULTISPECIES: GNAT family N-acetyltransferase [unclassified Brevibacterium]MCD1286090.1 N-acetyltransferase [Brevibacterium sp. CCUG 69071]MDK8433441.1 GNAT family N-acetyltransferase [Brevibacterium sp. H-BE7]